MSARRRSGQAWTAVICLAMSLVAFFHLWKLGNLPRGLYIDEASIGLNAESIAETFRDEHGYFMPVYFKAFGEYKNPLYIYTAAILFKVLGKSAWSLRAASFFYFAVFLAGICALTWKTFPGNRAALCYAVVATGTMPWIFTLSRISFEVISQPAVWIWMLYFIYCAYSSSGTAWRLSALAGFLSAISVYTYTTSRLLALAVLATLLLVYWKPCYWRRHAFFIGGAAVGWIPYIAYSLSHPGAMTARSRSISYFFSPHLGLGEKVSTFLDFYYSYLSPRFLILRGDANLRHHTGWKGELFFTVATLAAAGLVSLWRRRNLPGGEFDVFLVFSLVIAPVAAALTEPGHSLRSVLIGVYALLFSISGFAAIERLPALWRGTAKVIVFGFLIGESVGYLKHYFTTYAALTPNAFESYDFPNALGEAIAQAPAQVIVSRRADQAYVHVEFWRPIINNPRAIPLSMGEPVAQHRTCFVYFKSSPGISNPEKYRVSYEDSRNFARTKCFD